jgi:hypothetical protein
LNSSNDVFSMSRRYIGSDPDPRVRDQDVIEVKAGAISSRRQRGGLFK